MRGPFSLPFSWAFPVIVCTAACQLPQTRTDGFNAGAPSPGGSLERLVGSVSDAAPSVQVEPVQVADGGLAVVRILVPARLIPASGAAGLSIRGTLQKTDFEFYPAGELSSGQVFEALVGVPFGHEPGTYRFSVRIALGRGAESRIEVAIPVISGNYASETLKVDPRHVNPDPAALRRIKKESAEIGALYRRPRQVKEWSGPFEFPIQSPLTSQFGTRRVFNGEMRSFHQGLDLKAAVGTPIQAPAPGKVVLAKDLYMTGNTIILDHGMGLFTIYAHMSTMEAPLGSRVAKGQRLGLSGMTGRASGPHLHWGAVVHLSKINPIDLVRVLK